MAIEFVCPACQGTLSVADDAEGRIVHCGSCMTTLRVPAPAANSQPDAEPPPQPQPSRPKKVQPLEPTGLRGDLDEHGEPRRQRGTGKRKRSGRGPLFWILMVVLILGSFTCLSCGGLILVLGTPHWQKYEPPDGRFNVELPAPLNPDIAHQAKLKLKANESVEGTMLVGRLEMYLIWHTEIDPKERRGVNDDDILAQAVKNLTSETPGTIVRQERKKVDDLPATEVVITNQQGETHYCLIVVAPTRVYIVAAGGPFVSSAGNNKRIRRFLDSFHVAKGGNPWRGNAAPKKDD